MIFIVLFFPPPTLTFHILRARPHRRTVVEGRHSFLLVGYDSSWLLHMLTALDSLMAFGRLQIAPALLTFTRVQVYRMSNSAGSGGDCLESSRP